MYEPKKVMRGYEPRNAVGDEVKFPLKENLRYGQPELGPEPQMQYPSTNDLLDQLFQALEILDQETTAMHVQLDRALADVSETQCEPRPGPRISNSNITYRVAAAADAVDEISNRIGLLRRRITL